jgi:hypothetical protein
MAGQAGGEGKAERVQRSVTAVCTRVSRLPLAVCVCVWEESVCAYIRSVRRGAGHMYAQVQANNTLAVYVFVCKLKVGLGRHDGRYKLRIPAVGGPRLIGPKV